MIVPFEHAPIQLNDDSTSTLSKSAHPRKGKAGWRQKILKSWSVLHLSYRGGQYSVERVLALEEYTRNTPLSRAVLVCVGAPLPAILFALLQESLPLQDPNAGWSFNYAFWVRVFIVAVIVAINFIVHAMYMVPGCVVTTRQFIAIVLCTSIITTSLAVGMAALFWFPVPFGVLAMAPPFYPVLFMLFYVVVGVPVVREMRKHSAESQQYMTYSSIQQVMAVVYPAYQVLFHAATKTKYELSVILLLPVLKLIVKYMFLLSKTHMEDSVPEAVIFSVDFFNALYLSTSMECASSTLVVLAIVAVYIFQSTISLYRLNQRAAKILSKVNDTIYPASPSSDLLESVRCLCERPRLFQKQNRDRTRIRSCLVHNVSPDAKTLLDRLEGIPRILVFNAVNTRHTSPAQCVISDKVISFEDRRKITKSWTRPNLRDHCVVAPLDMKRATTKHQEERDSSYTTVLQDPDALQNALKVLFTSECLVIGAYLDAVVPLLYAAFLLVMVHLPNAKYHTDLASLTRENVASRVQSLFIYFGVECVSFGLISALLFRHLGLKSIYQLAFVLETQWKQIQAKMFGWILMTMAFRLVHFGIDFTFQFAWIKANK